MIYHQLCVVSGTHASILGVSISLDQSTICLRWQRSFTALRFALEMIPGYRSR
jgi:hypothetical protein